MGSVIVTGGLGVLGRAVVTTLKERGHRLAAVDLASGESDADIVIGGVDSLCGVATDTFRSSVHFNF